ncbi:MAG: amidohydrolase family protein, partial [Desulfovibrionaceae bacterium]|nr:amidohydrolase family protein [Desulfovibrionaceae bacterium]
MQRRMDMALGRTACDTALLHADVVDVFGREILPDRTVLLGDGQVLAVLPYESCPRPLAENVTDCGRRFLVPGLMDAHVHIESTLMAPEEFARAVAACGTTCVVADPHEIANVAGVRGIEYMLAASADLPVRIFVALPSCVPCTPFEEAGAVLDAAALSSLAGHERVCSLGEVMNYPGLLAG